MRGSDSKDIQDSRLWHVLGSWGNVDGSQLVAWAALQNIEERAGIIADRTDHSRWKWRVLCLVPEVRTLGNAAASSRRTWRLQHKQLAGGDRPVNDREQEVQACCGQAF